MFMLNFKPVKQLCQVLDQESNFFEELLNYDSTLWFFRFRQGEKRYSHEVLIIYTETVIIK